jgi:zinc transport system substrate-binding protein
MTRFSETVLIAIVILLSFSCGYEKKENADREESVLSAAASNYPIWYFVSQIGGNFVQADYPDFGSDPAYWKPSPEQIAQFQQADLIFTNGADYEKWTEKVSLPNSKTINTSAHFADQYIDSEDAIVHSHGEEGAHVHKGIASTTWLNFAFAGMQAEAVYKALVKADPAHAGYYQANYETLRSALDALDLRMKKVSKNLGDRKIIASHPIYQYLQAAYDLNLMSLHWEPDEMPSEAQWEMLKKKAVENEPVLMIWEAASTDEIKNKLADLDIKYIVFNPAAGRPNSGDFLSVMSQNIAGLEKNIRFGIS